MELKIKIGKKINFYFIYDEERERERRRLIEIVILLSTLPCCLSFYGQYFSLPIFIFLSHSLSLSFSPTSLIPHRQRAFARSSMFLLSRLYRPITPILDRIGDYGEKRKQNGGVEALFADRICRCRVSGRSPCWRTWHGNKAQPRYKDDFTRGVSILRYDGIYLSKCAPIYNRDFFVSL